MAALVKSGAGFSWRLAGWGGSAALLAVPYFARFPWSAADFAMVGGAFLVVGGLIELVVRSSSSIAYRWGAIVAILASLGLVWVNVAVGMLGDEDNPANLLFAAIIGLVLLLGLIGNFSAAAMARACFVAAAAVLAVAIVAPIAGLGSSGTDAIREAVLSAALFVPLWSLAGLLFRRAATSSG